MNGRLVRDGLAVSGRPQRAITWRTWLAPLSAVLALAGCVQAVAGHERQTKPPHMEKTGNVPEHGGGNGGGGGGSM
jgi:hypothetical protein